MRHFIRQKTVDATRSVGMESETVYRCAMKSPGSPVIRKTLCITFFLLSLITRPNPVEAHSLIAKVVKIIDGDTIEILVNHKIERVRIWGIDTPEWGQPYSSRSKKMTRSLLSGKTVEVVPKDRDKYGRLVAIVIVNHSNISEELVRSGLAWVHIYYCREPVCTYWKALQKKAMTTHKGLWHDPSPVAPWQWKKTHYR